LLHGIAVLSAGPDASRRPPLRNSAQTIKGSEFCGGQERCVGTIEGWARLAVLGLGLALAGCKTVENSLTANDISSMKLTGATVSYAPDATVQWEDGIRAYAAAKTIPDHELTAAANTLKRRPSSKISSRPISSWVSSRPWPAS
jgi:hypothetical protein